MVKMPSTLVRPDWKNTAAIPKRWIASSSDGMRRADSFSASLSNGRRRLGDTEATISISVPLDIRRREDAQIGQRREDRGRVFLRVQPLRGGDALPYRFTEPDAAEQAM